MFDRHWQSTSNFQRKTFRTFGATVPGSLKATYDWNFDLFHARNQLTGLTSLTIMKSRKVETILIVDKTQNHVSG